MVHCDASASALYSCTVEHKETICHCVYTRREENRSLKKMKHKRNHVASNEKKVGLSISTVKTFV